MTLLSEKVEAFIAKKDLILNKRAGWDKNDLAGYVNKLMEFGTIEVGYRATCGCTDATRHVWDKWVMVLKKLRADGFEISEEKQKHGNAYATDSGGFWESTVYTLKNTRKATPKAI